jgi:hypothetical protein
VQRAQSWQVSHRARAEQCGSGELAAWANRGTWRAVSRWATWGASAPGSLCASVGSVRPGCCREPTTTTALPSAATGHAEGFAEDGPAVARSIGSRWQTRCRSKPRSEATRRLLHHLFVPDPRAPEPSSNQQRLDCVEAFERGDASIARAGRPRAAESGVRKPEMAARPSEAKVAVRHARAGVTERKGKTVRLGARFVVAEHAKGVQREPTSRRATRANFVLQNVRLPDGTNRTEATNGVGCAARRHQNALHETHLRVGESVID